MTAERSQAMAGWVASGNVVTTDLGDGLALLDLRTNQYFSLNEVGAFVWQMIQTPRRREEIVHAVTEKYEVTPEDCSGDIDTLLADFENAALIEPHPGA